ncbi:major facilitator superfamily domain-containing protein [Mycotypha africana]|uniref:major facilitator superfamily domain-containing protein n=1 Tax=Mycotypha africana TaxID=64632 RepID=UPI00230158E2|nr:major facilitator superfamily domain-containing protein [Mycotypha africana]KAI8970084.1 major facilitator superfamily domain-containing protein [Mycotypha africana]
MSSIASIHTNATTAEQQEQQKADVKSTFNEVTKPVLSSKLNNKWVQSPIISCIAGCIILWASFGVRQSIGVFLVPVTQDTGWDRSTFSIAAAVLQLLWGFSQPFLVFLAERKFGFGKTIFISNILYGVGCFILYASRNSAGLYIFAIGVVVGISAGGNSFPNVLASVGRRFPQNSKQQSMAFGIVSSFGSFGQFCYLPMTRALIASIGWRMTFVVLGVIMVATASFAIFLQTVPPTPSLPAPTDEEQKQDSNDISEKPAEMLTTGLETENKTYHKEEISTAYDEDDNRPFEDKAAPDIKSALKEALTDPTFLFITFGFSVCGFHVTFLATHFPAYLQDNNINPDFAAWTISILGFCSMVGTIITGYLSSIVSPRYVLMGIYSLRAVFLIIIVFIPISVTTVVIFSVFFGFLWLSTVPPTTKFVNDVYGQKYLGTLTSITFVGHQVGAFLGAYIGGYIYDQKHSYRDMWYGSIAVAVFAVVMNFLAGYEPLQRIRIKKSNQKILGKQ